MFFPSDNTTNEFSPLGCVYRDWIQSCLLCGVRFSRKALLRFSFDYPVSHPNPLTLMFTRKISREVTQHRDISTHIRGMVVGNTL